MKSQRRLSLSQRLLLGILTVSFLYWGTITWLTVRDSIDDVYGLFDAQMTHTALALLHLADADDKSLDVPPVGDTHPTLEQVFKQWPELTTGLIEIVTGHSPAASADSLHREYEKQLRYQLFTGDGDLILRSAGAPATAITNQDGYSESRDGDGNMWRHFSTWDSHRHVHVVVSEPYELRNQLVRRIAVRIASPVALGLPVLIFFLWLSIRISLGPLGVLANEIHTKSPETLVPLDAGKALLEVRPMVSALNNLLQRMEETLENERRFTANAAHELRTPLAAIQTQLHVVRNADDAAERSRASDQLQRAVERGIRLVGQLLTLARLDPAQSIPDAEPTNIGEIATEVCAELGPIALIHHQTIELHCADRLPLLQANGDMLFMLISNLVDNAIRYTHDGGNITIRVTHYDEGVSVTVSDDGPGIPMAQRAKIFDRFYRIANQDQPGTGLGLAICRRIAELHRSRLELGDGAHGIGLTVRAIFPPELAV